MTPESVVINTSRQGAQAYKFQVFDMLDREEFSQGFAQISLVDQS